MTRRVKRTSAIAFAIAMTTLGVSAATAGATPRAYELVTPQAKGFANVDDAVNTEFKFTVAEDGESLGYCNASPGGAQVGTYCGDYISQRTPERWNSRVIAPLACGQDPNATEPTFGGQKTLAMSGNLEYAVIGQPEAATCAVDPLDPDAPLPGSNLYRMSLTSSSPTFDLLTPELAPGFFDPGRSFNTRNGAYGGGSRDASHLVYKSTGDQSGDGVTVGQTQRLYEWVGGSVRLVSRGTDNLPLNADSSLGGNPEPVQARTQGYGAVSDDGARIYFQSPVGAFGGECEEPSCELYLRDGGVATYKASEQECSPACAEESAPDVFRWANPDGTRALFETTAKLVDADSSAGGADLYMYRHPADPISNPPASEPGNLTLLSDDDEAADGDNAALLGVLGMSDDGNTVYFVAGGQLVSGESIAAGPKVYRWIWNSGSPQLQFLALLGDSTYEEYMWNYSGINERTLIQRVTRDGEHLLLDPVAPLDPATDQDSTRDVYRWAPVAGWTCLSCQPTGAPSAGESNIKALSQPLTPEPEIPTNIQYGQTQNAELVRVANDSGDLVFFSSRDQLTADDINATADIYEWNDGVVTLISGGSGDRPSRLVGSSRTADDVFFITSDRLVGWDRDSLNDVYDARVGGGFKEPDPPSPPCEVPGCRGEGTVSPVTAPAATAGFAGPGNPPRRPVCRRGFKPRKVRGKWVCRRVKPIRRDGPRGKRKASHETAKKGR